MGANNLNLMGRFNHPILKLPRLYACFHAIGPRAIVPLVAAPLPRVFTPVVLTPVSGYPAVFGTGTGFGCVYLFRQAVLFILTPYDVDTVTVPTVPEDCTPDKGLNVPGMYRDEVVMLVSLSERSGRGFIIACGSTTGYLPTLYCG